MLHYTAALSVQLTRGSYDTFRSLGLGRVSGSRATSSLQEQLAAAVARGTIVLQQPARVVRLILLPRQWELQQKQRC
jgi:hypothetical protein